MPISVLIADDQELVRQGLRTILEAAGDIVVVGEAADGASAVEEVARLAPDVALIDVRMPGMNGLEATRVLLGERVLSTRVLVMTTFDLDEYVYGALRNGSSGFLLKDAPRAEIIDAVRAVAAGNALISPAVTRRLIERFAEAEAVAPTAQLDELTAREREVLGLIARGLSNSEIGAELFLSEGTVKTHVGRVLMKLGLRDRVQAVVLSYELGIVTRGAGRA